MKTLSEIGLTATAVKSLFITWFFAFLILGAICTVLYFLYSFSLYKISSKFNLHKRWYSFVPFLNCILLDSVSSSCSAYLGNRKKGSIKALFISKIVLSLCCVISFIEITFCTVDILFIADKFMYDGKTVGFSDVKGIVMSGIALFAVNLIVFFVYMIIKWIDLFRIYKVFVPQKAVLYLLVSVILPVFIPILLYAVQNGIAKGSSNITSKSDSDFIL